MTRFRLLQHTVEIRTGSPELRQDLERLTACLSAPADEPDLLYTVEQVDGAYTLRCNGSSWDRLARGDVFARVETDLSRRLVQTEDHALLHAAALARDEQVYLLAGCSGCGKTTLTAALLKRGFTFLSDEYAPISLEDRSIERCSMPLKLLQSTVRRVPPQPEIELLEHGFFAKGEPVFYGVPDPALVAGAGSRRLARIIFPWNRPEMATTCWQLKPGVAIGQIMEVTLNAKRLGERAFALAADLAASLPCFDLVVGDIDEACRIVCEL